MFKKRLALIPAAVAAMLLLALSLCAQEAPEYGPAKGTLVIVGGGNLEKSGIYEKFIELAGGSNAKFVIVPTAGGNRDNNGKLREYKEADIIKPWLERGLKNVSMLHT